MQETAHTDSSEHVCGSFLGPVWTDEPVNIVCGITMVGQFIKILRTSLGSLVLCEVEVYADETFSGKLSLSQAEKG